MPWRPLWIVVVVVGAFTGLIAANSVRFARGVSREAVRMWAAAGEPRRIDHAHLERLPAPAREYLARATAGRDRPVRAVRLRHGGAIRPKLDGGWMPIHGRQYFAVNPPGFIWWGRAHAAPGLWIDARDRCVFGVGSMRVSAESSVTVADAAGPEIDQGSLLRLLGEMAWFPTALLDPGYVEWAEAGPGHARARLRVGGREVSATFEFGADGLAAVVAADRYRDLGGGRSELIPWSGRLADYREVDGLLVPHELTASWHVGGRPVPYARFRVEQIEYDVAAPF